MKPIKVWFPDLYTEAHFRRKTGAKVLCEELSKLDINMTATLSRDCSIIFCGSFFKQYEAQQGKRLYPTLPVVHYVWDLYPFQFEQRTEENQLTVTASQWHEYRDALKRADEVWVPSDCTVRAVRSQTGVLSKIVKTSTEFYDEPIWDGGYVLDPLRGYPDPCEGWVKKACDELKIPCIETGNSMPWDEFKRTVAGARVIVCAKHEASTGGLTLLEGYYLGKHILASNSLKMGAVDYFGERAMYYQWDDFNALKNWISTLYELDPPNKERLNERQQWCLSEYGDARMARDMASRFRELVRC